MPDDPGSVSSSARMELSRQLVGNNDEVTDLRFVGPPAAPTHVAVATNSEQVGIRLCFPCWSCSSWSNAAARQCLLVSLKECVSS